MSVAAFSPRLRPLRLTEAQARWLTRGAIAAACLYLVFVSAYLLRQGSWPTPDFLIPPLILIALLAGRGWSFVVDWFPFLLLVLVYESFRGVADDLNSRVAIQELVDAERWIAFGGIPTVSLQEWLYDPGSVAWYDWLASALHALHFVVPVAFGFAIWLSSRRLFWRYAGAVIGLFFAGFLTHFLYPAAPPWMASQMGLIPEVHRVLGPTLSQVAVGPGLTLAYQEFSPNAVAAMPSLHAALPLLVAFIALAIYGRWALPLFIYPLVGGVAWVYLGEHYFIDVLAGWVFAVGAFALFWVGLPKALSRLSRRGLFTSLYGKLGTMKPLPNWVLGAAVMLGLSYVWLNPLLT